MLLDLVILSAFVDERLDVVFDRFDFIFLYLKMFKWNRASFDYSIPFNKIKL